MGIKEFLDQFESKNTRKTYKLALHRFHRSGVREIAYPQYLLGLGLSNKTVNHQMVILQQFFKFLGQPFEFKRLKESTPAIEVLSTDATERLLGAASEEFRAVLRFMMDSGVRVGEMAQISSKQYEQVSDTYTIVGKGNKQRMIVISQKTKQLLEKSFHQGRLFGRAYSVATIQRLLKKAAAKAWLKGVHAHLLRHSFSANMLKRGVGIDKLQQMLGHSSINTTMIYTHISKEDLKNTWNKALL